MVFPSVSRRRRMVMMMMMMMVMMVVLKVGGIGECVRMDE